MFDALLSFAACTASQNLKCILWWFWCISLAGTS